MYDVMLVGTEQLMGEVIQILGEKTVVQVYEETSGIRPGEPVADTGKPLTVELGPGLLGNIYDGVQRPLPMLQAVMGDFILRGVRAPGLSRDKQWAFKPAVEEGAQARGGQVLGTVQEAKNVEHRVLDVRSEEHTSELQSPYDLVCRLLLEKKNTKGWPA